MANNYGSLGTPQPSRNGTGARSDGQAVTAQPDTALSPPAKGRWRDPPAGGESMNRAAKARQGTHTATPILVAPSSRRDLESSRTASHQHPAARRAIRCGRWRRHVDVTLAASAVDHQGLRGRRPRWPRSGQCSGNPNRPVSSARRVAENRGGNAADRAGASA